MSKAYVSAVAMLARREHGAAELLLKMAQKGHIDSERFAALVECQRLGLQSDERFAESVCRARIRQGYGSVRIRLELQTKQIEDEIIERVLVEHRDNWVSYALDVWYKKYKQVDDDPYAVIQKQKQFLLYRGFSVDTITMVFNELQTHE